MRSAGFLFRTLLLAVFTLSLLCGAIFTDYYLRHEVTRKAQRFLSSKGVELSPASAIEAAQNGEILLLENLETAGISLGLPDELGYTPLLAAVRANNVPAVNFLIARGPVLEAINHLSRIERETPLAAALKDRNFELAGQLLAAGADINVEVEAGVPFLVAAVQSTDREMLEFLLDHGVDVERRGAQPTSAFALASSRNQLEIMKLLLEHGASPASRGASGESLLIESVVEGNREKFDLLLAAGAPVNAATREKSGKGATALSFAVDLGRVEMQDALLENGASPDVDSVDGEPLIYDLVSRGDRETTRRLLEKEANTEFVTSRGGTPLLAAVENEDLEMVDLLLEYRADPSFAGSEGRTPLHCSVDSGNLAITNQLILAGAKTEKGDLLARSYELRDDPLMNLLLHAGADPESTFPGTDKRIFDLAVHEGATGAVRTLLGAGAKIGDNLWAALLTEQDDLIRLILEAGADPRQPGPDGQDPLAYCLSLNRHKAARTLLEGGADPDARYDSEETWLARSVREGNPEIALALVESGAEVEGVVAKDGHTLIAWSIAHGMTDVAKALIAAGINVDSEERHPAHPQFREMFESTTFRYHLQVDRRIRPIMMAAAQRNHEVAQALMDAGANGRAYTPRYLMAAIIGSWYKDVKMQQIALIGRSPESQPRKLVVSLSQQRVTYYENGVAKYSTRCSTGKPGHRTPAGEYVISDRHRHHTSSIYGSSMPYFQRFSFSAFGIHQGHLPGYPASAGCIRLTNEGARFLFGKLQVGDYAVIVP